MAMRKPKDVRPEEWQFLRLCVTYALWLSAAVSVMWLAYDAMMWSDKIPRITGMHLQRGMITLTVCGLVGYLISHDLKLLDAGRLLREISRKPGAPKV